MKADDELKDVQAIERLIERQSRSLRWSGGATGDWDGFASDFYAGASLYPSARPVKERSVDDFIEGLAALASTKLHEFHEKVLGTEIRVFGNIAIAAAGCEFTENKDDVNRRVAMLLLVKNKGRWRIAAQAWDTESADRTIPARLAGRGGEQSTGTR